MDDDFNGLFTRDFGFKPSQGKSAPMAPPRNSSNNSSSSFSSVNFGLGSGGGPNKSAPFFDDHGGAAAAAGAGSDGLLFNDVFGGPPKRSFEYDSVFKDQSNAKTSSLPVFDRPVYDDDIFDGLPGLKSSSMGQQSANLDDVFGPIGTSSTSPPKHRSLNNNNSSSPFDDLLGNLGKRETKPISKRETATKVVEEKDSAAFDDLLAGFGRSSSPGISRSTSEYSQSQKPSTNSVKTASSVMEDPFVVLESTSTQTSSSRVYADPLEEIGKFSGVGSTKDNSSINRGIYDDIDSFDNLGKSVPQASPGINKRGKDRSPLRTGPSAGNTFSATSKESVDKYPVDEAEGFSQKMSNDDFDESHETLFYMPNATTDFHRSAGQSVSSPSYMNAGPNETISPPRYEDISESSDDIWLTVSEVPLFTQPTTALPPSRPPPPRPPRFSKSETGPFSSMNSRKKVNEYSFSNSSSYSQSPRSARVGRSSVPSQIEELEEFATVRTRSNSSESAEVLYGDDMDMNASSAAASAAAMKEAMDKAEAKFRQMREREHLKASRSREAGQLDKEMHEAQQRELRERQERLDREKLQREREEEDREQRRLEKEREKAREIERERGETEREQRRLERERERAKEIEREKARQAVERATREARERAAAEARERAAAEARAKAERAAVGKAASEARERAERAAVQRAQAEARERAAAEARERAERAAAEARERVNAESRERETRERAAVARAEADARQRAERAAFERAAAEARERAAAAARANQQRNDSQQRNENDFESFFTSRASSAPRPRNTSDPFFDTQNKGGSEAARRTSVGATSNIKKASSTTNIVDDLSSIFGGTGASGEFPEVEGETEERRRARMERHQRTQERAAKALAEKNQRDLQAQREQAERHRIAETLDTEIKRWAAGKEGNLRALLSTLQYVLWPECGWQPVSLTDLITGASVKKVYRKATLCIHPDKVQQKGANLQQKYVAEKVFDLLKEAWNKFNSEELF